MISDDAKRTFRRENEAYVFSLKDLGLSFRVDRLRRERHELNGELAVDCDMAGARTVGGSLSVADFNLSSLIARKSRAMHLQDRSRAPDVDWVGLIEELCQRVLAEERAGTPSVSLRDIPRPTGDAAVSVLGVPLLLAHPMILFGDGGSSKSYLALYMATELARQGIRVGLLDWELDGGDHRVRLEAICGGAMPDIRYKRCDRPLVHMRDEVQRMVRVDRLGYLICDSIAFACDTKPEDAEAAQRYLQTTRSAGVGSLHLAHISKAEGGDQKPFGSAFWHNGARATWFVRAGEPDQDGRIVLALHNRKANLTARRVPQGVAVTFTEGSTTFASMDLQDDPDAAAELPVPLRIRQAVKHIPLTRDAIAEELPDVTVQTLNRVLRREVQMGRLIRLPGVGDAERFGVRA
jgi:hypothetical protein